MKNIIIAYMSVLGMASAYAVNDDVVNSQMYVDDLVDGLQTNLPAKTSDKVVTYTTMAGTVGERDIKTSLGNETTNQADTGISTIGTIKTAVDDKQNKLKPLNNVNIVTYTGTNNDSNATGNYYGRGVVTTTPIYDSTVNTFDNGLVTAKTLNDAVIAGVNAEATKITTDPKGALWVFNRTAPKVLPTTANLPANISATVNGCYKRMSNTNGNVYSPDSSGACTSEMYNSMEKGDWAVVFSYGEVKGESFCGTIAPVDGGFNGKGYGSLASNQSALTNEYNTWVNAGRPDTVPGIYCYCRESFPIIANPGWVLKYISTMGTLGCAYGCPNNCAGAVGSSAAFRSILFAASPVPAQ